MERNVAGLLYVPSFLQKFTVLIQYDTDISVVAKKLSYSYMFGSIYD